MNTATTTAPSTTTKTASHSHSPIMGAKPASFYSGLLDVRSPARAVVPATIATGATPAVSRTPAKGAIPAGVMVGAQDDKLYVHLNGQFVVLAAVGAYGRVRVAAGYPAGFGVKSDALWVQDHAAIAKDVAYRVNSHEVLVKRLEQAERRNAALQAQLLACKALLRVAA